jgi:anti-sigma factor (TIGR02949 family)
MVSCEDTDRLVTAYLDAEVSSEQRRGIEEHLAACPPCARRARVEGTARRVLMVRAESLSVRAPAGLRERCTALAPGPARSRWRAVPAWRRMSLATASLAVLVLAGALVYGVAAHSATLLAAELTLDHMKCFALFEPRGAHADPAAVAGQLEKDYGWHLAVPGSLPSERLTLLGARRCFSTDGSVAHVLYRHDGHPVSLFMMPRTTRDPARVAMGGRVTQIWSRGDVTYVLLGDESDRDMPAVATYFQSARF